ncbi:recombinase family protein [Streptomyces sp. NPDC057381]|uniref:recombinase family protein n=1 Tax=Streptomyces sp. NPDC057381 TaxID=3346111 RepID=UPI00362AFCBB
MPKLAKGLRVQTPADRGPGQPWRPGAPVPAAVDPNPPCADIRIGYARRSTLGQKLDSQLDALAKPGIEREKIFSEKISTRIKVRPAFEQALKTARESRAHARTAGSSRCTRCKGSGATQPSSPPSPIT